jgi:DnaJ like chaperone protein
MDCEAFARALVPLAAKMAKADGVAVAQEAEAFEKFLDVSASEMINVRRLYRQAQEDTAGFESYADQIGALLADVPETKLWVFECLFYIACADGVLHPAEDAFLEEVGRRLGYDTATISAIRASFVHDPESPYTILEVDPKASLSVIKRRYRKLVAANHPDHMIATGAPPAVLRAATTRLAAINEAYAQIVAERSKSKS